MVVLLLFAPGVLTAQPAVDKAQRPQVQVISTTQTQAIIRVRTTSSGPCFYRVSEGLSFAAPVNDVNPVLFPGSDSDARLGSARDSTYHYFVAGTRTAEQASDGMFYSRALQAATQHWVGVTCGTSTEVSATFATIIPTLGNTYPEVPNFDSAAFGNHAAPSIDFLDKSKSYIDPLTGILIKRLTGPLDYVTSNHQRQKFDFMIDLSGAWSNLSNSGNSATISTPKAPLFLSWSSLQGVNPNFDFGQTVNDLRLRANCSSKNGGKLQACISLDTGVSCATDVIEISCPTQVAEIGAPANYPAPMFTGWGIQHKALSTAYLMNSGLSKVDVSGNIVTWKSDPRNYQFYTERAPGSRILIPGTAPGCPNNLCTIASMDTPNQITIRETVASPVTNATMQDLGAGVLVWLKDAGAPTSVSASFTFDYIDAENFLGAPNANLDSCSSLPITDIQTDKDGIPYPDGPKSGYLCNIGANVGEIVLWIPDTGEARLISTMYTAGPGRLSPPGTPFSNTDPKTLFAGSRDGHLWKGTLNTPPGIYKEYVPGPNYPPSPDNLKWTDLSASAPSLENQLKTLPGAAANAAATGLMPTLTFWGVIGGYPTYISYAAGDNPCLVVRTSGDDNLITQAFTSWDKPPLRWGGCHFSPVGIGNYQPMTFNAVNHYSPNVPLGGPYTLEITQLKHNSTWTSFSEPITNASSSNPAVFTSPAHGLDPRYNQVAGTDLGKGPTIRISGGTGAWSRANGSWQVLVNANDPDHFTVPGLDSTSFGPLSGSMSFIAAPPIIHSRVRQVSSDTPAVVTIVVEAPWVPQNHRLQSGDPIGFGSLDQSKQFYAKVLSPTTFQVFSDPQLTHPVAGTDIAGAKDNFVYFAEMCPSDLPALFTTSMPFDSGAAIGPRCITVRLNGEPCSLFAGPAEHSKLPCKADPNNPLKSSLQDLLPGDAVRDIGANAFSETLILVKKVKNSENDIEATFMRWYGNRVTNDTHTAYWEHHTHPGGWTPFMVPSWPDAAEFGWMDVTDKTNTMIVGDPRYALQHGDFGHGNAAGLVTYASGLPDSISNKTAQDLLATNLAFTHKENPAWAGSPKTQLDYDSHIQSYPGHRQIGAPPAEHVWKGDWRALNGAYGSAPTSGLMFGDPVNLTKIGPRMYKINNIAGAFDRKRSPTYAWAGKWMFKDKSGPNSLLTANDIWNYCVADNPGECQPGSAKNDAFLVTGATTLDDSGHCWTNTLSLSAPCLTGANPEGGWAVQQQIDPIDTVGNRFRRLTLGFTAPGMHWTFQTWLQTPGGKWGFFSSPFVNGLRNEYFAMKLPPWPALDAYVDQRSSFITVTKQVTLAQGAHYTRARFGYAENGPVDSFFCTTRLEACSTEIPAALPGDPYSFVSESTTHQPCSNGSCTINIPAVPGRVLYFVIDQFDGNGNPVGPTPGIQVATVP